MFPKGGMQGLLKQAKDMQKKMKKLDEDLLELRIKGYVSGKLVEVEANGKKDILSIKIDHVVLATGGSAVYSTKAMEYLKMNSLIIFLEVPFDQILERVPSFLDRGFAKEPNQSIEDAFLERQSLYSDYADHIIVNTKSIDSCVSRILNLL